MIAHCAEFRWRVAGSGDRPWPASGRFEASGSFETRGVDILAHQAGALAQQSSHPDVEPRFDPRRPVYNGAFSDERESEQMAWRVGVDIGGTFTDVRWSTRPAGRSRSPRCRRRRAISRQVFTRAGDRAMPR